MLKEKGCHFLKHSVVVITGASLVVVLIEQ